MQAGETLSSLSPHPFFAGVFAPQRVESASSSPGGMLLHPVTSLLAKPNLAMLIPIPGSRPKLLLCQPSGQLLFSLQNPPQVTHSGKPLGH